MFGFNDTETGLIQFEEPKHLEYLIKSILRLLIVCLHLVAEQNRMIWTTGTTKSQITSKFVFSNSTRFTFVFYNLSHSLCAFHLYSKMISVVLVNRTY